MNPAASPNPAMHTSASTGTPGGASSSSSGSSSGGSHLSEKDADQAVMNYLRRKGYKKAEAMMKDEQKVQQKIEEFQTQLESENEAEVSGNTNIILFHNRNESASSYRESYGTMREWIFSTLDVYRQELISLLYPLFVHCYLDMVQRGFTDEARSFLDYYKKDLEEQHSEDIVRLAAVTLPEQMQENDFVKQLRTNPNNRFVARLSRFSFELLLSFLHEKKYMLLLSLLNQYLNIKVYNGQPNQNPDSLNTMTGYSEKDIIERNKREYYFGLYEDQIPKPKEEDPTKKKPTIPKPKSQLNMPKMSEEMEALMLEDIRVRPALDAQNLPSICFYTVFHAHQGLNVVDISDGAGSIAGGFSDSSVKVWDLKRDKPDGSVTKKGDHVTMVGHSGPVYGLSYSPDGQYLLSSSEDKTARLWDLRTYSNVVVYKGHNYPVWDVDFSSLGFLFATASHDRTARLWSTDKIHPLRIFAGHLSDVNCVKFHPNCNYVATGSTDKSLRLWDIQTGATVRIFTGGHVAPVHTLALSPDGNLLASAADDHRIIIWDLGSGKKVNTFTDLGSNIWSLDFSNESSLLASGGSDNTVRLWEVSNTTKKQTEGATARAH
eukprot:TRINITY_DN3455_c0_g1_i1.p1 TRINITY_DN3455_c0_g1~~TRINITY_DN3455_c0_g1_i1.p1  ORF type:complete len:604 (+),score=153.54 TRINITY_DN3455_c0_g1_i1:153-1964(+)